MSRLRGYLELLRPANVVTAWADVAAGAAVAGVWRGGVPDTDLLWLVLATSGLYAGGVVLNDVFDAPVDASERPERPIPRGAVSRGEAGWLGGFLLVAGCAAAARVGTPSLLVAAVVAAGATLYDGWAKSHALLGPLTMGACRGGNLLLGLTAGAGALVSWWGLGAFPLVYVTAITGLSRGEVHGGSRNTGRAVVFLFALVTAGLGALEWAASYRLGTAWPFLLLFVAQVAPPLLRAVRSPTPVHVRTAVKTGVLAIVTMDAVIAGGFGGWSSGGGVLAVAVLSWGLSRLFAVT